MSRNGNQRSLLHARNADLYPFAKGFLEFNMSYNRSIMRMNSTVELHP